VLIHHSDTERMRILRRTDIPLALIDFDLPGIGPVVAHHALDQRALAGTVLAQQSVERPRLHFHRYVVQRSESSKALGHVQAPQLQGGVGWGIVRRNAHGLNQSEDSASTIAFEFDTLPNTPPCILTILMAAR
jgi:hypothetical protein